MTGADGMALVNAGLALPTCRPSGRGGRTAAAAYDEDVVTLGAMAVLDVLERASAQPTALLLATTSSPLAEGGVAQEIAELTGLAGPALHVAEHGGTVAAGLGVLPHAAGVLATVGGPVVVVAAEDRRDARERPLGAGAICLVLDHTGTAGRLRWVASSAELVRDQWRPWDERGIRDGDRALAGAGASPPRPDQPETVISAGPRSPRLDGAGVLGCAAPLTAGLLAAADANPDDVVRLVSRAGGVQHTVDLTVGRTTGVVGKRIQAVLDAGIDRPPPRAAGTAGFEPFTSGPRAWRERGQDLRLEAQRDRRTGETIFPAVPGSAGRELDQVLLSRTGRVLTMTTDRVYPYGGPVQMVVVELDDGGRFYGQAVPEAPPLEIDDPVHLVPRTLYTVDGLAQRYWKVAPATVEASG